MGSCAIILAVITYIFFQIISVDLSTIEKLSINFSEEEQKSFWLKHLKKFFFLNKVNLLFGFMSSFGLFFLSIISLNINFWAHATFACLFFVGNFFQVVIVTFLTTIIYKLSEKPMFRFHKIATYWKIISCIGCICSVPLVGPIIVWIVGIVLIFFKKCCCFCLKISDILQTEEV